MILPKEIVIQLTNRIEMLVNKGKEICPEFTSDKSSSFNSLTCDKCGYTADLHLLKQIYIIYLNT